MFLQDDLGHDDVSFNGNQANLDVTGNITAAARSGIILKRHYVHWHCSPTRRSFLTGRLPLHHSEFLSSVSTGDDIDLRWTTIAEKLKPAGYQTYWFGKGHTGYKSFNHLPLQVRKTPSWPRSRANFCLFTAVFPQECMGQLTSFGPN
jgi:arylsulfatase A-like enzyme